MKLDSLPQSFVNGLEPIERFVERLL